MNTHNFVIILHGPTGVGKTECADYLASVLPVEFVNSDMGQLYVPLSIGTAKPDWRSSDTPHHLFDLLDAPEYFSVSRYREKLKQVLETIWDKKKIPLIIGGSSYYVMSLFFPPAPSLRPCPAKLLAKHGRTGPPSEPARAIEMSEYSNEKIWKKLHEIDPERANQIDPSDRYRIERALDIWQSTGAKPSEYMPVYDPIADYYFIWITRDRDELYQRINERVEAMIHEGWIEEVKGLRGTEWEPFLRKKKIIGYTEILDYVDGKIPYNKIISAIQKRTRNYAKRQTTFWRMLKKKLESALKAKDAGHRLRCAIDTVNLTNSTIERYSEQLEHKVKKLLS